MKLISYLRLLVLMGALSHHHNVLTKGKKRQKKKHLPMKKNVPFCMKRFLIRFAYVSGEAFT